MFFKYLSGMGVYLYSSLSINNINIITQKNFNVVAFTF